MPNPNLSPTPNQVRILMGKLLMDGADGLQHEGIFRVPGDAWEMKEMRRQINEGADAAALVQVTLTLL